MYSPKEKVRVYLDNNEQNLPEEDWDKGREYISIDESECLYIHEGFFAAVLLEKEQAIKLHDFIEEHLMGEVQNG